MFSLLSNRRYLYGALTVGLFAVFEEVGRLVGYGPDPNPLMTWEAALVNHSTLIAWWLTWFGYAYVLVPACLLLIALAVRFPLWRSRVVFAIGSLLLSWRGADFFQRMFARPRRLDWVVKHETAFSYPSSHAAIVTGFYVLLAIFAWRSSWRHGRITACLLVLLGAGIIWSRLALAAHYATDLVGGILWGAVTIAGLAALFPINVFEGRPVASLE